MIEDKFFGSTTFCMKPQRTTSRQRVEICFAGMKNENNIMVFKVTGFIQSRKSPTGAIFY